MLKTDLNRYSRQILFSSLGEEGQKKLLESKVLLIGCGALGSNIANFLVRAGIGNLLIIDRDFLELNNLQRQTIFDEEDVKNKLPKAIAAENKLKQINSSIKIKGEICDITPSNIEKFVKNVNLVMDGTDNMETRFLINDACIKHSIPWIYGGVIGSTGMTMNIIPNEGACLRCFITEVPPPGTLPTCDTYGILNTIASFIASIQVTEAIKILSGSKDIKMTLTYVDIWNKEFLNIKVEKMESCITCGKKEFNALNNRESSYATVLCGRNSVQITPPVIKNIPLESVKKNFEKLGDVFYNGFLLQVKIEDYEIVLFANGRAIIKGTTDKTLAKELYSRYIGN